MPVENGIVDLFHRAWGQMVNNPERNKNIDFKPINTTVERREGGWGVGHFSKLNGNHDNGAEGSVFKANQNGSTVKA